MKDWRKRCFGDGQEGVEMLEGEELRGLRAVAMRHETEKR